MRVKKESTDVICDTALLNNNSEEETNSDDLSSYRIRLEDDGSYSDKTNSEDEGANDMNIKIKNYETPTMENIKVETLTEEEVDNNDVKYDDNDRPIRLNRGNKNF